jgi:hypothetical protein
MEIIHYQCKSVILFICPPSGVLVPPTINNARLIIEHE